jgi:hypothetical protein
MKTRRQLRLKTSAFFFITMTMLQSCVAYHKAPVSLQQAEQSKKMVKVETNLNQTYHFKQIVLEEEQFYGLKKEKGDIVRIAIHNNEYNKVFLHSKNKSTWTTIAVVIGIPVIALVVLAATGGPIVGPIDIFEE